MIKTPISETAKRRTIDKALTMPAYASLKRRYTMHQYEAAKITGKFCRMTGNNCRTV